jgi:hypothetical protein
MPLSEYIDQVVDGLDKQWTDQKFRKYVGVSKDDIRKTITDIEGLDLIKRDVYALWEQDVPVDDAVEELYEPLDRYYQGTASVM